MEKFFYSMLVLVVIFFGTISNANAQVTIGDTQEPKATLDIKTTNSSIADGILLPRLTGDQLAGKGSSYGTDQNSVLVFVTAAASSLSGKMVNVKSSGFYYYDSAQGVWVSLTSSQSTKPEWFYMPPVPISVSQGTGKTINLFSNYKNTITSSADTVTSSNTFFRNIFPNTDTASDFDYYVVGYDDSLFDITSIDANGVMTYNILKDADDESYINIVFVRKN